ncbi:DUF2188 domain-containing protein [Sorangium sp. So ce1014]|uniref:DUF2188 domain-containing protein n=1 Tax=Sorangium sp. So ce1014 TaxID=3133326 RepID=UPI003F63624F
MMRKFAYHVLPDPDGRGWIVAVEGYVAHSLPYGTKEEAIEVAEGLVRRYPGSTIVVDEQPPRLTPIELEHRLAA